MIRLPPSRVVVVDGSRAVPRSESFSAVTAQWPHDLFRASFPDIAYLKRHRKAFIFFDESSYRELPLWRGVTA